MFTSLRVMGPYLKKKFQHRHVRMQRTDVHTQSDGLGSVTGIKLQLPDEDHSFVRKAVGENSWKWGRPLPQPACAGCRRAWGAGTSCLPPRLSYFPGCQQSRNRRLPAGEVTENALVLPGNAPSRRCWAHVSCSRSEQTRGTGSRSRDSGPVSVHPPGHHSRAQGVLVLVSPR